MSAKLGQFNNVTIKLKNKLKLNKKQTRNLFIYRGFEIAKNCTMEMI